MCFINCLRCFEVLKKLIIRKAIRLKLVSEKNTLHTKKNDIKDSGTFLLLNKDNSRIDVAKKEYTPWSILVDAESPRGIEPIVNEIKIEFNLFITKYLLEII